jgi:hypothetical protein
MGISDRQSAGSRKVGGFAALYLALAYIAAFPYYLVVVDYQGATTAAEKVALVIGNYPSMYAMYVASYMVFGIALAVLAFALHDRLQVHAPAAARLATAVALLWSAALVATGMVYTYGMTTIVALAKTDLAQAITAWQGIEPVALGLGSAGGEFLGGLWVLLVSWVVLQSGVMPKALGWLGVAVGMAGLVSVMPPLKDATYAFGLLQIVWFGWIGATLLRTTTAAEARASVELTAVPVGGE